MKYALFEVGKIEHRVMENMWKNFSFRKRAFAVTLSVYSRRTSEKRREKEAEWECFFGREKPCEQSITSPFFREHSSRQIAALLAWNCPYLQR